GQTGLADRASLVLAPTEVPGVTGVQQLAVGGRHTCALHDDGSVSCWGLNRYGQLGDGTFDAHEPACAVGSGLYDCSADPVSVILPSAATFLAAGGSHACAILDTGEIYCWGSNNRAQVGNLDRQPRATPVPVLGFE
ncbi:MAG: hypothetical protein OEY14_13935, partial [Myxococcales bacterium]|nr:hypothetical protein [Myxococcales bacterium]